MVVSMNVTGQEQLGPEALHDKITKNLETAVKEIAPLKKKFDSKQKIPKLVRKYRR